MAYGDDMTIWASLIMGVVFGITVFVMSGFYAFRFLKYNAYPDIPKHEHVQFYKLLKISFLVFLGGAIVYGIVQRFIIYGFAKKVNHDIDMYDSYRWKYYINSLTEMRADFVIFCVLIIIPFFIHYLICLLPTYYNANTNVVKPCVDLGRDE